MVELFRVDARGGGSLSATGTDILPHLSACFALLVELRACASADRDCRFSSEFAGILQGYALLQGADVMAHMQPTGGAGRRAAGTILFHAYCFLSAYEAWREGRTDASIIGGEVLNVNLFCTGRTARFLRKSICFVARRENVKLFSKTSGFFLIHFLYNHAKASDFWTAWDPAEHKREARRYEETTQRKGVRARQHSTLFGLIFRGWAT